MARLVKRRRSTSGYQSIVRDVWGDRWRVMERRPTPYGFAVYLGWPTIYVGRERGGKPGFIVTAPLAAHLRTHVQRPHHLPLPIGRKALRRVRKLLGVDHRVWIDHRIYWWVDRIDDLATLSAVKFAAKHGSTSWTRKGTLSSTLVCIMRGVLLGPSARPRGWWRAPSVVAVMKNKKLTLNQIADRLGISPITVSRIRRELRGGKPAVKAFRRGRGLVS
ncbi:MAG TPA: hypothetical protein VNU46_02960 [Gemmatimonadaceae bacterium]|nr:hypothetical protein [Gemmatimonadaceae bacterium]